MIYRDFPRDESDCECDALGCDFGSILRGGMRVNLFDECIRCGAPDPSSEVSAEDQLPVVSKEPDGP